MMVTNERTAAYEMYLEAYTAFTGISWSDAQAELSQGQFEEKVRKLHQQYLHEEFSLGRLADLLKVPAINLVDILNTLGLATYR